MTKMSATAHYPGKASLAACCLPRTVLAIVTLVAAIAAPAVSAGAEVGLATMICTNPSSGVTWRIKIDYDRRTVDSFPASIGAAEISWRDTRYGGNYLLDRKSGDLRVAVPSSTGGFFLHDRCKLDQ